MQEAKDVRVLCPACKEAKGFMGHVYCRLCYLWADTPGGLAALKVRLARINLYRERAARRVPMFDR